MLAAPGFRQDDEHRQLANLLKKQGNRPLVVACDVYRPAAVQQLVTLAKALDVPYHEEGTDLKPAVIAVTGSKKRAAERTHLLVDTAGRLHIDEEYEEVADLREHFSARSCFRAEPCRPGRRLRRQGVPRQSWHHRLILTKMDGDARGGAALSSQRHWSGQ